MRYHIRLTLIDEGQKDIHSDEIVTADPQWAIPEWLRENDLGRLADWRYTASTGSERRGILNTLHFAPVAGLIKNHEALLIEFHKLVAVADPAALL